MSEPLVKSRRKRNILRAVGAMACAVLGVVLAALAPGMFSGEDTTAGVWARWAIVASVVTWLGVVVANLVGLRDREQMRSLAGLTIITATIVAGALVLGGFILSADGVSDALEIGLLLSAYPLIAIGLAIQTRGDA